MVADCRSKVMKGILARLAAWIEEPMAAASSARAMIRSTPWLIRSSMLAACRVGSASATLMTHLTLRPAAAALGLGLGLHVLLPLHGERVVHRVPRETDGDILGGGGQSGQRKAHHEEQLGHAIHEVPLSMLRFAGAPAFSDDYDARAASLRRATWMRPDLRASAYMATKITTPVMTL